MFRTNDCSSSGGYFCTRSLQYFTVHDKILYAACTEITSWNNHLFETCRGYSNKTPN